jgi:hypothetical protein
MNVFSLAHTQSAFFKCKCIATFKKHTSLDFWAFLKTEQTGWDQTHFFFRLATVAGDQEGGV